MKTVFTELFKALGLMYVGAVIYQILIWWLKDHAIDGPWAWTSSPSKNS